MLRHWRIKVIEINDFTVLVILGLLAGVGYGIGWPTGATLRRAIAIRDAPRAMSVVFVVAVAIAGEILYVGLYLLRMAGMFDLGLAARLVGQAVAAYTGFWISCKLALLLAIGFFCALSASQRKTVRLEV